MDRGKDLILVTGATGQQGGSLARKLLERGHKVRALTRKPDSDAAVALRKLGAEVVAGELDDAASLASAAAGAWGVFGVQNTWEAGVEREEEQGKRLAEVAHKAGVQHYVYASVGSADRKTGIPHFDNKWRVEEAVRSLGFPSWTILRPVFFMENLASPWFKPAILEGKLAVGMKPGTVLQMIAVDDIGKFGLQAFERHQELAGRAIEIAGDEQSMTRVAEIIGEAAGRKVEFLPVPIEEVRKFSEDFATMFEWFDRVGYSARISELAGEFGIQPTTLAAWAARANWS